MSRHSPLPDLERLNELFHIDEENGVLIHKKKFGVKSGTFAGTRESNGYIRVKADGKLYLAHRLIYKMYTGIDPGNYEIDHIDGVRDNNRPYNLRVATRHQNRQNVGVYQNNSLNSRGVWFDNRRKKYFCAVQAFGVREQFGPFNTLSEAANKYEDVSKDRFGEFYKEP